MVQIRLLLPGKGFASRDALQKDVPQKKQNPKPLFYKGVTLLRLWLEGSRDVEEREIMKCFIGRRPDDLFGNRLTEIFTTDDSILSSLDVEWWEMRPLDRKLNELQGSLSLKTFTGYVCDSGDRSRSSASVVHGVVRFQGSAGLDLSFRPRNAPREGWAMYEEGVEFFVTASVESGLMAHPVLPGTYEQMPVWFKWKESSENFGRIRDITTANGVDVVIFEPAENENHLKYDPVHCNLDRLRIPRAEVIAGDLYSFRARPDKDHNPWRWWAEDCKRQQRKI